MSYKIYTVLIRFHHYYNLYFVFIYIYIYIYKDGCCWSKERIRLYFKMGRSTKRFVLFEFIYFVLIYVLYLCMFPACCCRLRTCLAQGLFNWVLNETWTHSCFQYKWLLSGQTGLYRGHCSSFPESTIPVFDIWYVYSCACEFVLVLEWFWVSLTVFFVCVSKCVSWGVFFMVFKFTGSSFAFFLYMYTYVCVCVCDLGFFLSSVNMFGIRSS